MGGNFRFNRLAKQLPGAARRQRIVDLAGATHNCIVFHGVSLASDKLASSSTPGYAAFILHHQDSYSSRRAISPSADRRKMTLAGATQPLYRLSWRIPFFGKLASSSTPGYAAFILRTKIRYSSRVFCFILFTDTLPFQERLL